MRRGKAPRNYLGAFCHYGDTFSSTSGVSIAELESLLQCGREHYVFELRSLRVGLDTLYLYLFAELEGDLVAFDDHPAFYGALGHFFPQPPRFVALLPASRFYNPTSGGDKRVLRTRVTSTVYNRPMKILLQILVMVACLAGLMVLSSLLTRLLSRTLRRDWLYYLLLAPGTIFHELCHTITSLVLLVPVREVHLFRLRHEPDGTVQLGEVVHDTADPIRNFFIAVAPLLGASVLIYFLSVWLLPKNESWEMLLRSGWTYLFLVIVFFIALGLSPSRQDFKALPAFLITAFVGGLVGYFIVWMVSKKVNLSSTAVTVEKALRTANTGLVFVLVVVAVVVGVLLVIAEVVRR